MKNAFLFMVFAIVPFLVFSQEQYKISFDEYQIVEDGSTSSQYQIKFPFKDAIVVMGGLNDLNGMNNYFNIFGSKLIIDKMDLTANGIRNLVLRREDGRNFYDMFPTLSAKVIPISIMQSESFMAD